MATAGGQEALLDGMVKEGLMEVTAGQSARWLPRPWLLEHMGWTPRFASKVGQSPPSLSPGR